MEVNADQKSLQIFILINLKRPLNWSKQKNNKDQRKRKRNCKTSSKVKCIQISYKKCFIWHVIGRFHYREVILWDNVNWDLKTLSAIERCPLQSVHYIKVLLWEFDRHFICSWKRCPLKGGVRYKECPLWGGFTVCYFLLYLCLGMLL